MSACLLLPTSLGHFDAKQQQPNPCNRCSDPSGAQSLFPFKAYFEDAPGGLFRKEGYVTDMERARGAFRHLKTMFQELEECRAFELLKVRPLGP